MRRYVYAGSLLATGVLIDELAFWALSHVHGLKPRGFTDWLRDKARF